MIQSPTWAPFCGAAPAPAELLGRWNLDPWLLLGLAIAAGGWVVMRRRGWKARDGLGALALAVLILAFVSPLCALSSALFSARTAHHLLLIVAAAPLLAWSPRTAGGRWPGPAVASGLHALALWAWHAPGAYGWALSQDGAYWLMQASLLGTAVLFWGAVRRADMLRGTAALLFTLVQTGALGALLTFADRALYEPHALAPLLWGLQPLEDQQLAGLIMWAPMAGVYLIAALLRIGRGLGEAERREASAAA
jgi:putative membrane protein